MWELAELNQCMSLYAGHLCNSQDVCFAKHLPHLTRAKSQTRLVQPRRLVAGETLGHHESGCTCPHARNRGPSCRKEKIGDRVVAILDIKIGSDIPMVQQATLGCGTRSKWMCDTASIQQEMHPAITNK